MMENVGDLISSPKKRIVVLLDGTWNTVNDNTNVWRVKSLCAPTSKDGLVQRAYRIQLLLVSSSYNPRAFAH